MPRAPFRSGIAANPQTLWDNANYVFGVGEGKRSSRSASLAALRDAFLARTAEVASATRDDGVRTMLAFLESSASNLPTEIAEVGLKGKEWVVFAVGDAESLVHLRPGVRQYLAQQSGAEAAGQPTGQCLVTGQPCVPKRTHPPIRGVPPKGGSGMLAAFNHDAFASFGLEQSDNAPVGHQAAEAYTSALTWLLARRQDGKRRSAVDLTWDVVTAFWVPGHAQFADIFALALDGDPEAVRALLDSPWAGRRPHIQEDRFYAATLSTEKSRVVVRDWFDQNVAEVVENIRAHFEDTAIVRPFGNSGPFPLRQMLRTTALLGKDDHLKPRLAAEFFSAILKGRSYPRTTLQAAISRMQAEGGGGPRRSDGRASEFPPERAALIKGYLVRAGRRGRLPNAMEVTMSLDKDNPSGPYRLGRLFATLEKLQEEAIKPGATIRDRFFGRASANPVTVFPSLLRGAAHHYPKVHRRVFFETRVQEIVAGLSQFPSTLSLEEQGMFALGYYHERQDLFTKQSDNVAAAGPAGEKEKAS